MATVAETRRYLSDAVAILATGPGRINERLLEAANRALHLIDASAFEQKGMNVDARDHWKRVHDAITSKTKFDVSIGALSEDEAAKVAERLVSLEVMLRAFLNEQS